MDYTNLKIPNHVAIIVDGNGRWGEEKGLNRSDGHKEGFLNVKILSKYIFDKGISYLSAYLFSTENFKRSKKEVKYIMNLLTDKLNDILEFCHQEKIKAVFSGRTDHLSKEVINAMNKIVKDTKNYHGKTFNLCFGYGAHAEIVDATKKISKDVCDGKLNIDDINEEVFSKYLYQDLPAVDLLIRTGGEIRLSNFMLWQISYAELYFTKTYFPDFKEKDFDKAIIEYTKRDRRFGGVNYEKENN